MARAGPATSTGAHFDATSDDGGRLLENLGFDFHVQGGRLFVSGSSGGAGSNRRVEGDLELEEFRVVQAPILAEILNLGSLEGIESMLRRDGIAFTHARIPFVWSHAGFEFREARAVGGIGLTGDCTFDSNSGEIDVTGQVIPAYSLNSALGKIPLIGHILVGGEGQGVFGINYRVGGNRKKPEVSVNPLSALTPGILRQMFVDPFTRKPAATIREAFAIGSITKNMVAALMLQLAEEGKLSLDDPIGKWLPSYPQVNPAITIRQKLGHGLFDPTSYHYQTLKDNVGLFTPELLDKINQIVVAAGHELV